MKLVSDLQYNMLQKSLKEELKIFRKKLIAGLNVSIFVEIIKSMLEICDMIIKKLKGILLYICPLIIIS